MRSLSLFVCLLTILLVGCRAGHTTLASSDRPSLVKEQPTKTQEETRVFGTISSPYRGKLSEAVNQRIVVNGSWRLAGKFGPYMMVDNSPVYLLARGDSAAVLQQSGPAEDSFVSLVGVLHKQEATAAPNSIGSAIPEYYYMEFPDTVFYILMY